MKRKRIERHIAIIASMLVLMSIMLHSFSALIMVTAYAADIEQPYKYYELNDDDYKVSGNPPSSDFDKKNVLGKLYISGNMKKQVKIIISLNMKWQMANS